MRNTCICFSWKIYTTARKTIFSFSKCFEKMVFPKKSLEIWYFLLIFWKDGLSKNFAPEHDIFCNIWKDGISYFQKVWYFFFTRKMKEDDLYQKMRGHLGVKSPASMKKMISILEIMVFLLKYHIHWHPRKGPRSSHRRCSTRKGVLRNFAKFTGKDLCQSLFFNKATGLRPATLLKKKLWRRCFPVNFAKFLRTLFLQNTPGRLILEFQLFILCSFMETFIDVFIYCFPVKEKQET